MDINMDTSEDAVLALIENGQPVLARLVATGITDTMCDWVQSEEKLGTEMHDVEGSLTEALCGLIAIILVKMSEQSGMNYIGKEIQEIIVKNFAIRLEEKVEVVTKEIQEAIKNAK